MSAIRVAGNAFISKGPPWARRFGGLKLGRLGFPPGTLPKHLIPYLFKKGGIPATCAAETVKLTGANRVMSMNTCVARLAAKGAR